jgi:hypothetical protein
MAITTELTVRRIDEIIQGCTVYIKELTTEKEKVLASGVIPSVSSVEYLEGYAHAIDDLTQHLIDEEPSYHTEHIR